MVKNLSAMQETWVQSLGWEEHLEKEMATHSSILAWKIPWTEEAGMLQSLGWQRVGHDWATSLATVLSSLGESFSLQIEDKRLVEFDLSSWTYLILISLCYALGLCHSFKSCALPLSLLFHALFLNPFQAHNVVFTIFWRDNQKIAGPWEGNTI